MMTASQSTPSPSNTAGLEANGPSPSRRPPNTSNTGRTTRTANAVISMATTGHIQAPTPIAAASNAAVNRESSAARQLDTSTAITQAAVVARPLPGALTAAPASLRDMVEPQLRD